MKVTRVLESKFTDEFETVRGFCSSGAGGEEDMCTHIHVSLALSLSPSLSLSITHTNTPAQHYSSRALRLPIPIVTYTRVYIPHVECLQWVWWVR